MFMQAPAKVVFLSSPDSQIAKQQQAGHLFMLHDVEHLF